MFLTPQILSRLKRQTSVPNFTHSAYLPPPETSSVEADKQSSRSLARTSSVVSVGGVESAQSGYLASDGSSLTLDGEQDCAPSQIMLKNGEWNGHVDSLVSPTSPLEEIFDCVFEQHIRQYSNTSSASSANQSTYYRAVSPPLRSQESEDCMYNALPRRSTASSRKLLSSFEYQPCLSATSNEGVDV